MQRMWICEISLTRDCHVALKYSVHDYPITLQLIICNTQNKTLRKEMFPGPTGEPACKAPQVFCDLRI
jgi:hypothetical protein